MRQKIGNLSLNVFVINSVRCTKNEFFQKDFFSECDQDRRKLQICSHLLNKSLMESVSVYGVILVRIFPHSD